MGPYHCLRGGQACQYAFLGIKQAFNGDHREVLEDWNNGSVVKLESHVKRRPFGMFSGPVRCPVSLLSDLCGMRYWCRLALAFRPGSYRVPGGVKGRSWQVPGWYACGWYVKVYAKCLLNRMTDAVGKILFPVAIDWVLGKQQEKRGVKWVPETKFADLDFADDIEENARDLQPLVTNQHRIHAPLRSVTIDENKLKVAENFTYLGSSTNNKGQMDNELDCRLGKASAAFNQLDFETYYVEISQEKRKETGITGCF
ncbi:hypothetical protein Bbelb_398820 [Branchiostoma belcheri]|nr:hypothetical protein Bbelb_398820 [Branchiostoma belcheri]